MTEALEELPPLISLEVSRHDEVAEVTLLGPGKGNAMGPDFWRELPQVFTALDADPRIRAVVLSGQGKDFSYGLDLAAMIPTWSEFLSASASAASRTALLGEIRRLQDAISTVASIRKPVISAVSGWCVGGGVDLISATDIRLASADAQFSVREVKIAIVADLGSLQRLSGIIGEGHLRELAFTGRDIDAVRAEKIGLVNDVYSDRDTMLVAARALAEQITRNPPLVVQGVKEILKANTEQEIAAGLRYVSTWNAAFLPSEDLAEALQAFTQKRDPRFQGR